MDSTRITSVFLYTTLAVITYLMLLAWEEDYPPVVGGADGSSPALQREVSRQGSAAGASGGMPSPAAPSPSSSADMPAVPTEPAVRTAGDLPSLPQSASSAAPSPVAVDDSRLIAITTDTLDIRLNLDGGDIVYLALPQHERVLGEGQPFVLLESTTPRRTYIAQSGLIGADGIDNDGRAAYQSPRSSYQLADGQDSLRVDLSHRTAAGQTITKRYTFQRGSYLIEVSFIVQNDSAQAWQAYPYGQLRRDGFDDPTTAGGFLRTFLGFVSTSPSPRNPDGQGGGIDDPYIEQDFGDINDGPLNFQEPRGWIGFNQQYFVAAWVPAAAAADAEGPRNNYTIRRLSSGQYVGEFTSPALQVAPGGNGRYDLRFFAGPKDVNALQAVGPDLRLDLTIDYSWLWFLAKPMHWLLLAIEDVFVPNWGVAIIILTFIVKAVFYKLSETQYRSMAGMRRLMPKMQQLKESYGDDKMQL